jgi:hypothetical protein
MKTCPHCHFDIPETAPICGYCGSKQPHGRSFGSQVLEALMLMFVYVPLALIIFWYSVRGLWWVITKILGV